MNKDIPKKILGRKARDKRGSVLFVNDFYFKDVKRFYVVSNSPNEPVRGFHGHMKEAKYVFVPCGKILLNAIQLDKAIEPSKICRIFSFILSSDKPEIVYIPPGYANGFKDLAKNSKIFFYSTSTLQESETDDYRYPKDYWGNEIWNENKIQ
jgi:dTDP-4-dehydrorhamnose 3,5-epimerase